MHTLNEGFRADLESLGLRFFVSVLPEGITAAIFKSKQWISQTRVETFNMGSAALRTGLNRFTASKKSIGNRLLDRPITTAWNVATETAGT
jgi:hypothetical protein